MSTTMSNTQACPWEWDSFGNPMGNVPRNGTDKFLWDGNGTDKHVPWTTLDLSM